jgi:hypothetical protein
MLSRRGCLRYRLSIASPGLVDLGTVRLRERGFLAGAVTDVEGVPQGGALASVHSHNTFGDEAVVTGPDGTFRLLACDSNAQIVRISKPGYATALAVLSPGEDASVQLEPSGSVELDTGAYVYSSIHVILPDGHPLDERHYSVDYPPTSNTLLLRGLPRGRVEIRLRDYAGSTAVATTVLSLPGQQVVARFQ